MEVGEKIAAERKRKGITQQQLADLTGLTARTIQRIENGQTSPRSFTVNSIANALGSTFEAIQAEEVEQQRTQISVDPKIEPSVDEKDFLLALTLSCFSYILIPIVHFFVPLYILKRTEIKNKTMISQARKIIRIQFIWTASINLLMLATLAFNLVSALYFDKVLIINFLLPFFLMYALNAILITKNFISIKRRGAI